MRAMVPGDHLQLLYHFWLAHDMLAGKTPLFYNLYEFNTGNDAERRAPDAYYAPFSLVYAIGAAISNPAFGWNLAGFFSLWLGYLFSLLFARRFTQNTLVAAAAALFSLLLPFRLATLFGGSPTGLAIAWVPLVAWGLDKAVRDDSPAGGAWAGLGLVMAAMGDLHVFYFSMLSLPGWALIAWVRRQHLFPKDRKACLRLGRALLPLILLAGLAAFLTLEAGRGLAASVMAKGRSEKEILLFTPEFRGFFQQTEFPPNAFVFLGLTPVVVLVTGLSAALVARLRRIRTHRRFLPAILIATIGILLVASLALGPRGPFDGAFFALCRRLIPGFSMIRQTSKVFALMPTLLTAASAITLEAISVSTRERMKWLRRALPVLLVAALAFSYVPRIAPSLCRLDFEQRAYAAIASDAELAGCRAHALAAPLWPGDSHYSSLYQYYASLYRMRLVNGYSPKVSSAYVEEIFNRFQSVNAGCLDDGQIDNLLGRGVGYILLHEDCFPDKVSPFPVAYTLRKFMNHPRMTLLARDKRAWAFKLLEKPQSKPAAWPDWTTFFPARSWDAAAGADARTGARGFGDTEVVAAADSWGGSILVLNQPGAGFETRGVDVPGDNGLHWLLRVRGHGSLAAYCRRNADLQEQGVELNVDSDEWTWIDVPAPVLDDFSTISLRLELRAGGALEWDTARLLCGDWTPPAPGETISRPPALFFHAGYLDEQSGAVNFEAAYDRAGVVLYGPKLPLANGRYRLELEHSSSAADGVALARVNLRWRERETPLWLDLTAGSPAAIEFTQEENLPFFLVLVFSRAADMQLTGIHLTRLQ